jgi:hypothetical protein
MILNKKHTEEEFELLLKNIYSDREVFLEYY